MLGYPKEFWCEEIDGVDYSVIQLRLNWEGVPVFKLTLFVGDMAIKCGPWHSLGMIKDAIKATQAVKVLFGNVVDMPKMAALQSNTGLKWLNISDFGTFEAFSSNPLPRKGVSLNTFTASTEKKGSYDDR